MTVPDRARRYFLLQATTGIVALGAASTAVPFVASWQPSARTRTLGAPVTVDVSRLEPGEQIVVAWRRQPVYVVRRTPDLLARLEAARDVLLDPDSTRLAQQPDYAHNYYRSRNPEFLVLQAICTHLSCAPRMVKPSQADDVLRDGGFNCPCHGSRFDLAGRVLRGFPASANLPVPPYYFESATRLVIGLDAPVA